jgi:Mrp family chromosome partitioning ATPase/predicted Fe-Mo cluster-binding NifX family protein
MAVNPSYSAHGKGQGKQVMENINRKILVLSGKGGVGKSTIAANLAVWLSMRGEKVGLLDIDIHGPSIPKLLGLEQKTLQGIGDKITPVTYGRMLKVMSIGFLLRNENDALIWRGPMKHNIINNFVSNVSWDELDYLVVDCPPGTGDEPLSIAQLMPGIDGAVVITTPQQLAVIDVRKCITFCRQLNIPILGVIENMAGFICPNCGQKTELFAGRGGKELAAELNTPFAGSIPLDPHLALTCDMGKPLICSDIQSPTKKAMQSAFEALIRNIEPPKITLEVKNKMKIAIPITNGRLSSHFGHCEQFAIVDADAESKSITRTEMLTPPAHEPGVLPRWLSEMGVNLVIAGGMGQRALQLFAENNIDVVTGTADGVPQQVVADYLEGRLQCGPNVCDH